MVALSIPFVPCECRDTAKQEEHSPLPGINNIKANAFSKRKMFGGSPTLSAGAVCLRLCCMYISEILQPTVLDIKVLQGRKCVSVYAQMY